MGCTGKSIYGLIKIDSIMDENWNHPVTFNETLPYQILRKSIQQLGHTVA
jgi:hypothetical protein